VHDIDKSAELNLERSSEDQIALSLEKSRDFLEVGLERRSFSSTSGRHAFSFGHFRWFEDSLPPNSPNTRTYHA
jgi:hypothetical protein